MTVILVGGVAWVGSQEVRPGSPVSGEARPLKVQVVSLEWKWLFIYPEQGVATVNELVIPAGERVHFELTSSGEANSFVVPHLAGRARTMPGTVTQLDVKADHAGTYRGLSGRYGGKGLPEMRFTVYAVSADEFAQWVQRAKDAGQILDAAAYADLTTPSAAVPPFRFRAVAPDLFSAVVIAEQ
jgi:cytochrome o ubiquinol oxidase subunit 2